MEPAGSHFGPGGHLTPSRRKEQEEAKAVSRITRCCLGVVAIGSSAGSMITNKRQTPISISSLPHGGATHTTSSAEAPSYRKRFIKLVEYREEPGQNHEHDGIQAFGESGSTTRLLGS